MAPNKKYVKDTCTVSWYFCGKYFSTNRHPVTYKTLLDKITRINATSMESIK